MDQHEEGYCEVCWSTHDLSASEDLVLKKLGGQLHPLEVPKWKWKYITVNVMKRLLKMPGGNS